MKHGFTREQIFLNGKPLGVVKDVKLSSEEPVSDIEQGSFTKPGTFTATATIGNFEDLSPEIKKLFDEYKKAMDKQKQLNQLMQEVGKLVPTMLFVGTTEEKYGAFLMGSPEETNEKRMIDLAATVARTMEQQQAFRELLFSAVSWYMQENPKYQEAMQLALDKLKELNEHRGAAEPE